MTIHHVLGTNFSAVDIQKRGVAPSLSRRQFLARTGMAMGTALALPGCSETSEQRRAREAKEFADERLELLRGTLGAQRFGRAEIEYEVALHSGLSKDDADANTAKVLDGVRANFTSQWIEIPRDVISLENLWEHITKPLYNDAVVMNELEKLRLEGRIYEAAETNVGWINAAHKEYLLKTFVKGESPKGMIGPNAYNLHEISSCNKAIKGAALSDDLKEQILNDTRYFKAINNANIGTVNDLKVLIEQLVKTKSDEEQVGRFLDRLYKDLNTPAKP